MKQNEGITHQLFGVKPEGEGDDQPAAEEGEEVEPAKDKDPKHIFIPEVVREKNIKYFKVPKLGSYLAVKLSFNSCLSEEALEAAILDF